MADTARTPTDGSLEDIDDWKDFIAEVESWPKEEGKYEIRFRGEPEPFDHVAVCPDCGRSVRAHGISFGPYDSSYTVAGHQSEDCPALRNRLWRFQHHTLWRLGMNIRRAVGLGHGR